jgi:cystathionine beta-lyase
MADLRDGTPVPDLGDGSIESLRRRTSEKWSTYPPEVLPAFIAEMDFDVAAPIKRAISQLVDHGDLGYPAPHPRGVGEAFSAYAGQEWSWSVDPSRVHVAPDVMTGVAEVLRALTPPGSGVVVNPPVYPPFFFRLANSDRRVVPVPLRPDDFSLDLEALERACSSAEVSAYLLCSPHNPLGRVWTSDELLAIAEVCRRHDVLLLVDEIHAPLTLPGAWFRPFQSLDHDLVERTVVFHSASKAWNIPGTKCGLAVAGSPALSQVIEGRWEALFPSILGLAATAAAFSEPECREWLGAVLDRLDENRTRAVSLLAELVPGARAVVPEASFLVWVDCTELGMGDDPAEVFLERGRVALGCGPDFGEPGRQHVRVNIGTFPRVLEEIVRRMGAALAPGAAGSVS